MSKAARITTDDIILAGVTDFSSLFGIFGVRIWTLVEAVIQKADLSLPYYDTALVDRFQLGLTLQSLQENIGSITNNQETVFQKWQQEMKDYEQKKEQYERDYEEWSRIKK